VHSEKQLKYKSRNQCCSTNHNVELTPLLPKSFGLNLGLTLSGLGLDLGLMASVLSLKEIGLVA